MTLCPLCHSVDETVLYSNNQLRIIAVKGEPFAICRVIWQKHQAEMTDLSVDERSIVMNAVVQTEQAMRQILNPDKMNLAALGNQVPHLHWHIIARFQNDPCFPDSIWAPPRRSGSDILPENWSEKVGALLQELMQ